MRCSRPPDDAPPATPVNAPLLKLEGLAVGYDGKAVLSGITLDLAAGSFTGLLGRNGCGKSTLLRTLLGIIPSVSGRVIFHTAGGGEPAFGYVPQRESLDANFLFSSFEVVLMGACARVGPRAIPQQDGEGLGAPLPRSRGGRRPGAHPVFPSLRRTEAARADCPGARGQAGSPRAG